MDAKLKSEWLTKLRSGKYDQTRGKLRDEDGYCCLGILCLAQKKRIGRLNVRDILPDNIAGGLNREQQRALASMNDGGSTFLEIADYIEKNL